jgi:hypothetical protein
MNGCPNGNSLMKISHSKMNSPVVKEITWERADEGTHCKIQITGTARINGKIRVQFQDVSDAMVYVY